MKKNSSVKQSPKRAAARKPEGPITIGMDLGDKSSRYWCWALTGGAIGRQRGDDQRKP